MPWFYLSFADPRRPKGTQWLGGCYVEVTAKGEDGMRAALITSHVHRINPGGEVQITELPKGLIDRVAAPRNRWRLLNREELDEPVDRDG